VIRAQSLWELVEARADATPDALFAVDETDRSLSFRAYRDAALRAAGGLAALGVGQGTVVSWMLPTWLESMVLAAALARLGAVQNPILPIYREREVGFVTRQTGARLLLVPGTWRGFDYAGMARAVAAGREGLQVRVVDRALPEGDAAGLAPFVAPAADEVRWLFYTSGTTADPKGARHTDATLLAAFSGMVDVLSLAPDDRHGLVFPFTHIGGIGWLFAGLIAGFGHIVVSVFDPPTTIPLLARHGVTQAGAGTVFHQAYLAAQRERPDTPIFPSVRAFPGGGAPKPPSLHGDLRRELGGGGVVSGYGLTECPIIAMNRLGDPDEVLSATEGRANPAGAEIRVVRADGTPAAPGEEGELRVRGPQLCKGYVDASLDAAAFDAQGFFRTGDLGRLDAGGHVVVTGRLKDVIIRKGENISAKEVEDLLFTHPSVADAAVIGLPDPALGERCCAVVACAPGADLPFEEMVRFLKQSGLMVQKIPERLETLEELPRNASGKVLKNELRERFGARG
jgi:non-ribosomal peptide synthetase component E (peptide arylation enzyme)